MCILTRPMLGISLLLALCAANPSHGNWPAWRGGGGSGVAATTNLPLVWSATNNVRWKVPLPEPGNSTPIIWGDRVFLTQPQDKGARRTVICLDFKSGKQLWQNGISYAEKEESHNANPQCSASPVTDGERVIAWFGSAGVVCYDFRGKELWRRPLGKQIHEWGYASSPVLHEDLCILNFGPGPNTALVALDKRSGKTVWEVKVLENFPKERTDGFAGQHPGIVGSWSTPLLVKGGGRPELVMTFPGQIRAFDPATGNDLWFCEGINPLLYTSPICENDTIVAMGGFLGTTMAVKAGGKGNRTGDRLWQSVRTKNRLGSGVIHQGHVYILNTPGVAECIDLKTGKVIWEERLAGPTGPAESWSSMLLAGDKIYIPNQSGDTIILRASPKFEVLGANSIGRELTNASLAASRGAVLLRTHKNLWCFSAPGKP